MFILESKTILYYNIERQSNLNLYNFSIYYTGFIYGYANVISDFKPTVLLYYNIIHVVENKIFYDF